MPPAPTQGTGRCEGLNRRSLEIPNLPSGPPLAMQGQYMPNVSRPQMTSRHLSVHLQTAVGACLCSEAWPTRQWLQETSSMVREDPNEVDTHTHTRTTAHCFTTCEGRTRCSISEDRLLTSQQ